MNAPEIQCLAPTAPLNTLVQRMKAVNGQTNQHPPPTATPTATPTAAPTSTPTPTPKTEPTQSSTCAYGYKCKDNSNRAFLTADCRWTNIEYCTYGCENHQCKPAPQATPAQATTAAPTITPTPKKTATPTATSTSTPTPNPDCGELKNSECSDHKPLYCEHGELIDDCKKCGCDKEMYCCPATKKCRSVELTVSFVNLSEGTMTNETGKIEEITIEITHSDTRKIADCNEIIAVLTIDTETTTAKFKKQPNGLFSVILDQPIKAGEHTIQVELQDDFNAKKSINVDLAQKTDIVLLFALVIGTIIALFSLSHLKNHFKEKNTLTENQRFEIAKRKRMLKELKTDFYKRRLTEEKYKDKVRLIQSEIKELEKAKNSKK